MTLLSSQQASLVHYDTKCKGPKGKVMEDLLATKKKTLFANFLHVYWTSISNKNFPKIIVEFYNCLVFPFHGIFKLSTMRLRNILISYAYVNTWVLLLWCLFYEWQGNFLFVRVEKRRNDIQKYHTWTVQSGVYRISASRMFGGHKTLSGDIWGAGLYIQNSGKWWYNDCKWHWDIFPHDDESSSSILSWDSITYLYFLTTQLDSSTLI